ncbi:MAG: endonuclease/exonuclease/phosphatase family protein [Eubacteriales bacterium]|nr:endonuclease/exonuclease/phosphatase family protein [Eubacteriales bacterium]
MRPCKQSVILLLLAALFLCACNGQGGLPSGSSSESGTEAGTVESGTPKTVSLATNRVAAYQLILPTERSDILSAAADALSKKLTALTGVPFRILEDDTRDGLPVDGAGEIVIGNCRRTETQERLRGMTYRDSATVVTDVNILFIGYEDARVSDAVHRFIAYLEQPEHIEAKGNAVLLHWERDVTIPYTAYLFADLTLGGTSISEYRIVYPAGEDSAAYRFSAMEIRSSIGKRCGAVLPAVADTEPEQPHEILVGKTSRQESLALYQGTSAVAGLEYGLSVSGTKLLVVSGGLFSLSSAVRMLDSQIALSENGALDGISRERATLVKSPIPKAQGDYRFMTYNILVEYPGWGSGGVIPAEVEIRREIVSEMILRYRPDVAALEEVFEAWDRQLPPLIEGEYAYVCQTRKDGKCNRNPLIYRKDRLTLIDSGYVDIENPLTRVCRCVTWAVFEDIRTGARFGAMSTHWDPHDAEKRLKQAETMAALSRSLEEQYRIPFVAMGDFNSKPSDAEFRAFMTGSGLADLSGAGGYDHIFCNPAFSAVAKGVEKNNCVQYASDHYPVWVDVTLRKGQE